MSKCHLILCEKTGHWATALRVIAPPQQPALVETRSLSAAQTALVDASASVVAVHATPDNLTSVVAVMQEALREYPLARFVGLLGPEDTALDVVLREAGAIDVIASVLDLPRLTQLAERHAARVPKGEVPVAELVQARMPWKALATNKP
jgi:hypothetical protein